MINLLILSYLVIINNRFHLMVHINLIVDVEIFKPHHKETLIFKCKRT